MASRSFAELMQSAATPASRSADTWSCIRAIKGDTTTVSPSMTRAGIWKQRDLPEPVGITVSAWRPSRSASITASWPGRNPSKPKTSRSALPAAPSAVPPMRGPFFPLPVCAAGGPSDTPGDGLSASAAGRPYDRSVNPASPHVRPHGAWRLHITNRQLGAISRTARGLADRDSFTSPERTRPLPAAVESTGLPMIWFSHTCSTRATLP